MDDTLQKLVEQRRVALDGADDGHRPWGLALSGGGIRSATFCLGLVKALARNGQLLRFDIVSTVSGGGYIGSALGRLFSDARSSADVRAVQQGLGHVDEIRFGWWLRSNGRYLIPGGLRDTLFAVSLYLRNLLGTHIELAIAVALIGLGLSAFNLVFWWLGYTFVVLREGVVPLLPVRIATRLPTLYVLAVLPVVCSIVLADAYWAVRERPVRKRQWGLIGMWLVFGALALWIGPMLERRLDGPAWLAPMFALFAATWVVALVWVLRHNDGTTHAARLRNQLTDRLTTTVWVTLCIVLAGALDRLAWWFAEPDRWAWRASAGGVLLGIAAALRAVMPVLFTNKRELPGPGKRIGLAAASVLGLLLIFLLAAWWIGVLYGAILIPVFTDDGLVFSRGWIWWGTFAVVLFGYALASGRNLDFLNVSSLHMFYKARIVRGYLGAANSERLGASPTDRISGLVPPRVPVGEVDAHDDIAHADYAPQRFGGPVHLINICINQTHAPNERLFNRDRKSLPLTVAPGGRVQAADEPWQVTQPEGALTLGAWAAISGAAFAPGMGRMTQRGVAALAMMAGLRLGYWWDSKAAGVAQRGAQPGRTSWFAKSKYLLHECFAMFPGSGAAHWYLSDGGHFENTAAYALLRQEAELIVIADCGADPDYRFEDIENLIRRARIDLLADIRFKKPCDQAGWPELRSFGSLSDIVSPTSQTCLALAEVSYASGLTGRIVLVKPNVSADLPVDLVNFKA
ncbi:MAG: patatin-like phospholipase family protein, partial [Comamonadaceae bacterium]